MKRSYRRKERKKYGIGILIFLFILIIFIGIFIWVYRKEILLFLDLPKKMNFQGEKYLSEIIGALIGIISSVAAVEMGKYITKKQQIKEKYEEACYMVKSDIQEQTKRFKMHILYEVVSEDEYMCQYLQERGYLLEHNEISNYEGLLTDEMRFKYSMLICQHDRDKNQEEIQKLYLSKNRMYNDFSLAGAKYRSRLKTAYLKIESKKHICYDFWIAHYVEPYEKKLKTGM